MVGPPHTELGEPCSAVTLSRRCRSGGIARDARRPHRINFNLMGVGGLRTYLSFTRISVKPSIDHVFEGVLGIKSFPFLAGE
jgi:hypothetical protein